MKEVPRFVDLNWDVAELADLLRARFGHVEVRHDYGWPGKPAVCVLDCVLSLNRDYYRVVYPRVVAFVAQHPGTLPTPGRT